jgi:hypothetical protein
VRFGQIFLRAGEAPSGTRVLSQHAVEQMHTPQVELPTQLMAHRWGIGPYWKRWDGRVIHGHSGTNTGGSSTLLWVPERNAAIATVSNVPNQGYPLADEVFARVFPEVLGIARPEAPVPDPTLEFDADRAVGTYEAHAVRHSVESVEGRLFVTMESEQFTHLGVPREVVRTELLPLGGDRFLPADRRASQNRGWDFAFVGDQDGRATHLVTGAFTVRRVA